jgi:alkylhydroperoxidase family enzyme
MKPLPPDQWDPSLHHIIDAMNGRPIHIHCQLANHPALLNAWWNYRMHSVSGGDLEQRDAELVILRVAVRMQAWYEWAAHVVRGLAAGLSLTEIQRVAKGPSANEWSARDAALLAAVDQLIDRHAIDSELQTTLANYFADRQVMDIVSLQGMYVTIACLLGSWPLQVEDSVIRQLPPEVTEESFRSLLSAPHRD